MHHLPSINLTAFKTMCYVVHVVPFPKVVFQMPHVGFTTLNVLVLGKCKIGEPLSVSFFNVVTVDNVGYPNRFQYTISKKDAFFPRAFDLLLLPGIINKRVCASFCCALLFSAEGGVTVEFYFLVPWDVS